MGKFVCISEEKPSRDFKGKVIGTTPRRGLHYASDIGKHRTYRDSLGQAEGSKMILFTFDSRRQAQELCDAINEAYNDDFEVYEEDQREVPQRKLGGYTADEWVGMIAQGTVAEVSEEVTEFVNKYAYADLRKSPITQTIYKYPLRITDHQSIKLPKGYEILSIGLQDEQAFIWCLINKDEKEIEEVDFEIFGTGHDISTENVMQRDFIGTYFFKNGLVFHLFKHSGF